MNETPASWQLHKILPSIQSESSDADFSEVDKWIIENWEPGDMTLKQTIRIQIIGWINYFQMLL